MLMVTMLAQLSIIPPSPIAIRIAMGQDNDSSLYALSIPHGIHLPRQPLPNWRQDTIYPQNVEAHPLTLRLIDIARLPLIVSPSDLETTIT
jgi:hypothetical protein